MTHCWHLRPRLQLLRCKGINWLVGAARCIGVCIGSAAGWASLVAQADAKERCNVTLSAVVIHRGCGIIACCAISHVHICGDPGGRHAIVVLRSSRRTSRLSTRLALARGLACSRLPWCAALCAVLQPCELTI